MFNFKIIQYSNGESQLRIYEKTINNKKLNDIEREKKYNSLLENREKLYLNPFNGVYEYLIDSDNYNNQEIKKQHSIDSSLGRTKNKIYEISRSNVWEYFITLTFNKNKINRYDYNLCKKKTSEWLNNIKKDYAPGLKYIFVPELHKDGAFHFHGLISNIGNLKLKAATYPKTNKYHQKGDLMYLKNGSPLYNLESFKLGFSSASCVIDTSKVSSYISKYITKDLISLSKGKRRYLSSLNLDLPKKYSCFLEKWEIDYLLECGKDIITYQKTIDINVNNYNQQIKYVELKNDDIIYNSLINRLSSN